MITNVFAYGVVGRPTLFRCIASRVIQMDGNRAVTNLFGSDPKIDQALAKLSIKATVLQSLIKSIDR